MVSNTMFAPGSVAAAESGGERTLWGLTAAGLHDRYWAARGLTVVRRGQRMADETGRPQKRVYLLTGSKTLVMFGLPEAFAARPSDAVFRIEHEANTPVREKVVANADRRVVRIHRVEGKPRANLARVAVTTTREVAEFWSLLTEKKGAWRRLRSILSKDAAVLRAARGLVFDRRNPRDVDVFVRKLVAGWDNPGAVIGNLEAYDAKRVDARVWKEKSAEIARAARIIGTVWIGAGRNIPADATIAGPAVLWDAAASDGAVAVKNRTGHRELGPTKWVERPIVLRKRGLIERTIKRGFDIGFSLAVIGVTLPVYPLVMVATWIEDRRPFFFGHRREMRDGREFTCWKFRSMKRDAEKHKGKLKNLSNGPHFYVEHDPRMTRIGRVIRKLNVDELPQFFNVLAGQMSVVGPRPSPHKENQGCPTWREARLSVKPGITGLWQVKRTRAVGGDFQEWVKYDVEYVERGGLWMDFKIIVLTFKRLITDL